MTLDVAIRDEGSARVVALAGDVDHADAGAVEREVRRRTAGAEAVLLDLTRVGYLDSAGVTLLDRIGRDLGRRAVPLQIVVPAGAPARVVLRIVAFDEAVLAETLDEGLAALGTTPS